MIWLLKSQINRVKLPSPHPIGNGFSSQAGTLHRKIPFATFPSSTIQNGKLFDAFPFQINIAKKHPKKLPMQSNHHNDHFHSLEKTLCVIFIFFPISWKSAAQVLFPRHKSSPSGKTVNMEWETVKQWETGKTVNMEKNQTFILVPWQLKPDLSSDKFFLSS